MKVIGSLLGFFLSTVIVASLQWSAPNKVLNVAESYVGTTEIAGPNRHPAIDKWNKNVGVPVGSSYCASFVSFVLDSAEVSYPVKRTALAQGMIVRKSIKANAINTVNPSNLRGWLLIWKRGETWMGHTGFVRYKRGNTFYTIEANTSPSESGNQREGDGVWEKQRHIDPTAYFRITHFTPVY
jgi:hypothetical protein